MGSTDAQHSIMQYLNHILSQSGPNALPYQEELRWTIRQQVCTVLQEFSGLQARPTLYTHNDGRSVTLLMLDGTIPMYFASVKYNIPVNIWLTESFPLTPPLVYVTPTPTMVIKPRHRHVDASGCLTIPYLTEWTHPRSNLGDLIQICSAVFGQEPPLYSRPLPEPQTPKPPSPTYQGPVPGGYGGYAAANGIAKGGNGTGGGGAGRYVPGEGASGPGLFGGQGPGQGVGQGGSRGGQREREGDPEAVFKRAAVARLTERLRADVERKGGEVEREVEEAVKVGRVLSQRRDAIGRAVAEVGREAEALEQQLQLLRTNANILQDWMDSNDKGDVSVDVDSLFLPQDTWSQQALEAIASDFAIDDILECLDKAVQEDYTGRRVLPVEAYLRHVRALSKEQFFHRALTLKIRGAQAQAQVAQLAQRGVYQVARSVS